MPFSGLSAERLFWEGVEDGRRLAKAKAKPKHKNILRFEVFKMTPDEVIAELKKLGIKISRSTLLNYEKQGLIPGPKRGGAGKGKGRTTDYPDETPAEFYASHVLKTRDGARIVFIAKCRKKALLMEGNDGMAFIDWVLGPGTSPETLQEAGFGQSWLKEKHKVLHEGQSDKCPVCKNLKLNS